MAPKKGLQCKKPENACKVCLQSVTQKTGLQCSGACRTWVHYECVDYTPGKVKDIKDGIIRITCPCPDCETRLPKEYRVTKPTCANQFCPANLAPHCENEGCPTEHPPSQDTMNQTGWPSVQCGAECKNYPSINPEDPDPKPWPVAKCGPECKKHAHEDAPASKPPQKAPCVMPRNEVRGDCREAEGTPSFSVVGQMCSTIGLLAKQMNTLMAKMQDYSKMGESKPPCQQPPPCQKDTKKEGPKCCCSGPKPPSPGGCHNPVPCEKEGKREAKCCCSGKPKT